MVKWKLGVSPFSWADLKVLLVIVMMFLVDTLWAKYLSPLCIYGFDGGLIGQFADAILRTGIIVLAGIMTIYRMNVSYQMNEIIQKLLKPIFRKS